MSDDEGVTADHARDIGKNFLSSMIGESVDEFKLKNVTKQGILTSS